MSEMTDRAVERESSVRVLTSAELLALTHMAGDGPSPAVAHRLGLDRSVADETTFLAVLEAGMSSLVARSLVVFSEDNPTIDPVASIAGVALASPDLITWALLARESEEITFVLVQVDDLRLLVTPMPGHAFEVGLVDAEVSRSEILASTCTAYLEEVGSSVSLESWSRDSLGGSPSLVARSTVDGLDVLVGSSVEPMAAAESLQAGLQRLVGDESRS